MLSLEVFCCLNEEVQVAKRRNLKKEKAARNLAYARQFRKRNSRYSKKRGGGYSQNKSQENQENKTENKED